MACFLLSWSCKDKNTTRGLSAAQSGWSPGRAGREAREAQREQAFALRQQKRKEKTGDVFFSG